MKPYLELSLRTRGLRVVAGISDAPVLSSLRGEPHKARVPINWWLQPGGSTLSLQIEPAPAPLPAGDMFLDVAVCYPGDELPPLCRLGWALPPGTDFLPQRHALPFVAPRVPSVKLWDEAKPLVPLGPRHRKRAQAAGAELHEAFVAREVRRVLELIDYRMEEMARGFEVDEDDHRRETRESLEALLSSPELAVEPVPKDSIRTIPCCGGRAYHLARADGSPLIEARANPAAEPFTMQVFVAWVKNDWIVVR